MASAQASDKLATILNVVSYDHDPNSTDATAVEWRAMRDYRNFMAVAMASALTGNGVTAFTINGATNSSGANSTVIKTHALASAPDAVGDNVILEVTAEEVRQQGVTSGYNFTHVSAVLTMDNAADENVVTYIFANPRFAHDALSADVISS